MDSRIPNLNSSGLLGQLPKERRSLPKGFWKLAAFDLLEVILAAVSGYELGRFLFGSGNPWFLLAAFMVFFAAAALDAAFTASFGRRAIVIVLETVLFLGGVAITSALPAALPWSAGLIILALAFSGDYALRSDLDGRLRIRFFSPARRKIARLMTGYLLGALILASPLWRASALPLPEAQFRPLYDGALSVVQTIVPAIPFDSTVTEFSEMTAKRQFARDERFRMLTPDVQDKEVRIAAAAMLEEVAKNLSIKLEAHMKIRDVFYEYLTTSLKNWKESFGDAFSAIWIVVLFLFLRGLAAVAVLASSLIAALFYEILAVLGVIDVIGEPATKEKIILT